MSLTTAQFWQLLAQSQLLEPPQIQKWQQAFAGMKGAAQITSARTLGEWMVAEKVISRYQAAVLLAGHAGPFHYGDYRVWSRYESGRLAGRFRAIHVPSGHPVLLDFIVGPLAQDPQRWAAAAREAEQARALSSPHVAALYDLVDLTAFKFAVLEDLEGTPLSDTLAGGRRLPVAEACRIARCVALALQHLHQQGLVYGEVRPENIWLSPQGHVKLLGIPLCRSLLAVPGQYSTAGPEAEQRRLQVADYTAPELAAAGARAGKTTDIYALGCTLYEMLAGQPPFAGGDAASKMARHASEAIAPLAPHGVPEPLQKTVAYMMAKAVSVRLQDMSQVLEGLSPLVDPAALNAPVSAPSATLAQFQMLLQQRRAALQQAARRGEPLPEIQVGASSGPRPAGPRPVSAGSPLKAPAAAGVAVATEGTARPASGAASSVLSERNNRRRGSNQAVMISVGVAAAMVVVILVLIGRQPGPPTAPPTDVASTSTSTGGAATNTNSNANAGTGQSTVASNSLPAAGSQQQTGTNQTSGQTPITPASYQREMTIPDNGRALWASPTSGPPLQLKYLPPESQIYLAVRPAELLLGGEGDKIRAALGPAGEAWIAWLESTSGFKIDNIEQVLMGIYAEGTVLHSSLVVRLLEPVDEATMLARWNGPSSATHQGRTYYSAGNLAYYVPPEEAERVFAVTSARHIRELLELAPAIPPLQREMEQMLADTDATRHFTLLLAPSYMFGDGNKAIFAGSLEKLRKPLGEFLGDVKLKSTIVSFHLAENFFAELRVGGSLDIPPRDLAQQIHSRLGDMPREIRKYFIALAPHPYTREILAEFPEMIRVTSEMTRSDADGSQAVVRTYLPAAAAHNLVMGCELTLAQQPGAVYAASSGPSAGTTPSGGGGQSVAELLQQKTSLSFARDTLEVSLQMLSGEIGVEIVILGSDLQLDGITKNQSFGIDLQDQPAKKILEQILVLANPDKTATSPADPKQKLVYVVKPKDPGGPDVIFVTTRGQAERRGDTLPEEFAEPPAGTKTGT